MFRFIVAFVIAVACMTVGLVHADSFPDGPGGPNIAIINNSSLSRETLQTDLPYLQLYVDQVCIAWHCDGHLYLGDTQTDRDWPVTLNDYSEIAGAAGYHTENDGVASAVVSVKTSIDDGIGWDVVLTHELAEMLVDPTASAAANTYNNCDPFAGTCSNGTFYNYEIADPVQGESYRLGPLRVSDFVYRSWFEVDGVGPFDAGRHLRSPLSLAPNSYLAYYKDGYWRFKSSYRNAFANWDRFGPGKTPWVSDMMPSDGAALHHL